MDARETDAGETDADTAGAIPACSAPPRFSASRQR